MKQIKISLQYSPIFHRISKRKCTAAPKPFLLIWNGSCTTASSTMEVGLFDVPPATISQAWSGSAVDLPALFQVITNWRQPQRSSSRFASTRYSGLSENVNCVAALWPLFPFWLYDSICTLQMNEIEVCPECYLSACQKRDNWFCEPCVGLHATTKMVFYVTHLADTKANELFCFVPDRVNLTRLCGPN